GKRIAAVDRRPADAVAGGPLRQAVDGDDVPRGGHLRPAVRLAEEDYRQAAAGGEHQSLVKGALAGRAVAERHQNDTAGAVPQGGQRRAAGDRRPGADDRVLTDETARRGHDVGGAGPTAVDAHGTMADLAEELAWGDPGPLLPLMAPNGRD